MKRTISIVACVALVGSCIGAWFIYRERIVSTNDALIDGFKVAVCPDITARIVKLYVDEGDWVKAGDLLCDLDDTIPQSEKIRAAAKIETAEAGLAVEKYNFEKIFNDFERARNGFAEGVITAQQFDHAQKNYAMARSRLEMAQADLVLAKAELGVIETKLWHTKVYASVNGMIVKRWMYEGDVPAPGQAIFSLYELDNTWVVANLEETKMKKVRLGDPVEITLDIYPGKQFYGKVFVIKGSAASEFSLIPQDNATGNYTKVAQRIPLKISIDRSRDSEPLYLFPGLSAEVKIRVSP